MVIYPSMLFPFFPIGVGGSGRELTASAASHSDELSRRTSPQRFLQLNSRHPLPHFLLFLFTSLPPRPPTHSLGLCFFFPPLRRLNCILLSNSEKVRRW